MSTKLQEAIIAIQAGDKIAGQQSLVEILRSDPRNEDAWLWLAKTASESNKRRQCLERVLGINPDNEEAREALATLEFEELLKPIETLPISPPASVTSPSPLPVEAVEQSSTEPQSPCLPTASPSDKPALPSSRFRKTAHRWERPFRTERDVIEKFVEYIDELIDLAESADFKLNKQVGSLRFAIKKYEGTAQKQGTNIFLTPVVKAAPAIAEALLRDKRYEEAFWTGNSFAEMGKILVARSRSKYQDVFESLLLTALCAASSSWLSKDRRKAESDQKGEIISLRRRLEALSKYALDTDFKNREGKFSRSWQPDEALADRLINEALARHFDARLRFLLLDDRTRVKNYITINMPLIYKLELADKWASTREEWKQLLIQAGFEDVIRLMKDMGDLVIPDEVGQLSVERLEDVRRALDSNDFKRVRDLLKESADEVKSYLYREAQERLDYREPPRGALSDKQLHWEFQKAAKLAATDAPDQLREALQIAQDVWQKDIGNFKLRDWVAYLQAKTGNRPAAERMLEHVRKHRNAKNNFITDWNLAVLAYDRKDEAAAYQLLVPLLDREFGDEDLIVVLLALSLKLDDRERFLAIVPRTLSLRFHPLAIFTAYEMGDDSRAQGFLADFLRQTDWELPPATQRFDKWQAFEEVVNRAIVEGQIDQLVAWLEARIATTKGWVPNYLALARVLEVERGDVQRAFEVLRKRLLLRQKSQKQIDEACRDILELSKRAKRHDLGQQAYQMAVRAKANDALLRSFQQWAPKPEDDIGESEQERGDTVSVVPEPTPSSLVQSLFDPRLAERLVWVNARLTKVRNVVTYVNELGTIEEFSGLVAKISPQESDRVVELIQNVSNVIETFSQTKPEEHDARRVFYDRATGFEHRLVQLLDTGALSQRLADVITPYQMALRQVIGDLSRQAGIGPMVQAAIENPFISLETGRSTLVLRITNESERPANDVAIELMVRDPLISVIGRRDCEIAGLQAHQSELLNFPIQINRVAASSEVKDVTFDISILASAEGFPNFDLGITSRQIPVREFTKVIGGEQIPKLFQVGQPLRPSDPLLFQGRDDILRKIKSSFFGGIQRERYFLDGIRRAGKTSILNFLPGYLPENLIPVHMNLDISSIQGPINSAVVFHRICSLACESVRTATSQELDLPDLTIFEQGPGQAFSDFLSTFRDVMPERVPFLMIDEFQDLLKAIARTGPEDERDTLVLDQLRGHLDAGNLYAIFTGSVRFDRLSGIVKHRIFGNLTRLRVSFLSEGSVQDVLRAGIEQWATIPTETVHRIYELTGGYPWLVQTYGTELVDLLNQEQRTIATPGDVDKVTRNAVLPNKELFEHWWPTDQLGSDDERFIEELLRLESGGTHIPTRTFLSNIPSREQPKFRRAFDRLRACEVLDSTQTEVLKFRGQVLRQWIEQQYQDGRLRIQKDEQPSDPGQAGIFVDHENFVISLERISRARGIDIPADKVNWLSTILGNVLANAEERLAGRQLRYKVTAAFWNLSRERDLQTAYYNHGFTLVQPEQIKTENAVDFKVADEVRRAREQAMRESTWLSQAIIVSGDGDLSHVVRALINDGVNVQIWAGSRALNRKYAEIVGEDRVVALDDVCGL